jgi:hypothetical protein
VVYGDSKHPLISLTLLKKAGNRTQSPFLKREFKEIDAVLLLITGLLKHPLSIFALKADKIVNAIKTFRPG